MFNILSLSTCSSPISYRYAFDHFSSNLDQAFDFVQASFLYKPIPTDFAGNILKLAVNMMDVWQHKLDGAGIFRELSFMVASCIMLDSARNKTRGLGLSRAY